VIFIVVFFCVMHERTEYTMLVVIVPDQRWQFRWYDDSHLLPKIMVRDERVVVDDSVVVVLVVVSSQQKDEEVVENS